MPKTIVTVYDDRVLLRKQTIFRSILHTIYTQDVSKVALSPHDTKRYIIPVCGSGVDTLARGHYAIPPVIVPTESIGQEEQPNSIGSTCSVESIDQGICEHTTISSATTIVITRQTSLARRKDKVAYSER